MLINAGVDDSGFGVLMEEDIREWPDFPYMRPLLACTHRGPDVTVNMAIDATFPLVLCITSGNGISGPSLTILRILPHLPFAAFNQYFSHMQ